MLIITWSMQSVNDLKYQYHELLRVLHVIELILHKGAGSSTR
jgi:hypothetical protein